MGAPPFNKILLPMGIPVNNPLYCFVRYHSRGHGVLETSLDDRGGPAKRIPLSSSRLRGQRTAFHDRFVFDCAGM